MRNASPRPCERRGAGRDRLLRRLVSTDTIGCTLDAPQQVSVGGSKRPCAPQRIDGKVGADNNNSNKGFNDLFGFVGASVHEDEPSSICDGLHAATRPMSTGTDLMASASRQGNLLFGWRCG